MKNADAPEGPNSPFTTSGTSPPRPEQPAWLTAAEAAAYLRCAVKTLYNYKCSGLLKGFNLGGRKKGELRFRKCDLDAFIFGKRGA